MTPPVWQLSPARSLTLDQPRVLGILNITPDSFSDGGAYVDRDAAVRAAAAMLEQGADGLDIGAESTRPGAARVSASEQIARSEPIIAAIRRTLGDGFAITIDTTLCDVARAALDAGADAVNDVSAGTEDPAILELCAERRRGIILMHRLRPPGQDIFSHQHKTAPEYAENVLSSVRCFLNARAAAALLGGIRRASIVLDPGLGFGKSVQQNLDLIAQTRDLAALGYPILSGISRKSFTAAAIGADPATLSPRDRVHATVGLSVTHLLAGASIFRVHDVREHTHALRAAVQVARVGCVL